MVLRACAVMLGSLFDYLSPTRLLCKQDRTRKPANRSNCDSSGGGNGVSSLPNMFGRGDASRKGSSKQLKDELVHGAVRFGHKAQGGGYGPGGHPAGHSAGHPEGHPAGHPTGNSDGHSRGEDPRNSTADVNVSAIIEMMHSWCFCCVWYTLKMAAIVYVMRMQFFMCASNSI